MSGVTRPGQGPLLWTLSHSSASRSIPLFNLDISVAVGLQIVFLDEHLHRLDANDCIAVDCFGHFVLRSGASGGQNEKGQPRRGCV